MVSDRNELPTAYLAAVEPEQNPMTHDPLPLVDEYGTPPLLRVQAEAEGGGTALTHPYLLGRYIKARVERGTAIRAPDDAADDSLMDRVNVLAEEYALLEPDPDARHKPGARPRDSSTPPDFGSDPHSEEYYPVRYIFPGTPRPPDWVSFLAQEGYYRVKLVDGATYRVDPARQAEVRQVAGPPPHASQTPEEALPDGVLLLVERPQLGAVYTFRAPDPVPIDMSFEVDMVDATRGFWADLNGPGGPISLGNGGLPAREPILEYVRGENSVTVRILPDDEDAPPQPRPGTLDVDILAEWSSTRLTPGAPYTITFTSLDGEPTAARIRIGEPTR